MMRAFDLFGQLWGAGLDVGVSDALGALGLLNPSALFFPVAFDIVGMGGSLLAACRFVPSLEFHIAQLLGVQRRTAQA